MRPAFVAVIVVLAATGPFAYAQEPPEPEPAPPPSPPETEPAPPPPTTQPPKQLPDPTDARVVLADVDTELLHALQSALAPWRLEIVVDENAPASTEEAEHKAKDHAARFVVWRREGDLVVYDLERGAAEHRSGTAGAMQPDDAAAAALTVKTLMRLPTPRVEVVRAVPETGASFRAQLGFAMRITRGGEPLLGARIAAAGLVRPWSKRPWRFGLVAEAGPSESVENLNFRGTWRDWAVLGVASLSFAQRKREVEPFVAAGVQRSFLTGKEGGDTREEGATLPVFRAGGWVRWRIDRFSIGGSVAIDLAPTAPSYAKMQGNGIVFDMPTNAFAFGLFAAAELGE